MICVLQEEMMAGEDPLHLSWTKEMTQYIFVDSAFASKLFTSILSEDLVTEPVCD